ncbi:MAG: hypothetical protein GY948_08955 [Alphaproteobacteria bacterium]|nr:hypothetical protein [Alphaproteobacteria bacterium]
MPDKDLEPDAQRIRLEQHLNNERAKRDQLEQALSEFRHTGRRISDRLERLGGRGADLEQQRSLLAENLKLTQSELSKTEAQINKIRRELSKLAADQQS